MALALLAFDTLRQLALIDPRYPLVLERHSLEEEPFQQTIRSKSLAFVFERLMHDLRHSGCNLSADSDAYRVFRHLYHGVRTWPIESRDSKRLQAILEVVLNASTLVSTFKREEDIPTATIDVTNRKGLILAYGSSAFAKSTIAKEAFQTTTNDSEIRIYIDAPSGTVTEIQGSAQSTFKRTRFAALGKRRFRLKPSEWSQLLRLSKHANEWVFALFEAMSRKPILLIVDEPAFLCNGSDFSLILATLLKYSTTNSTMIVTSSITPELWMSANIYAFLSNRIATVLTRQELIEKYPASQMLIRYSDQGINRYARLPFAPDSLSAFQANQPHAVVTDIRLLANDWSAIYKFETGEELL
jgi:hypothetical protein